MDIRNTTDYEYAVLGKATREYMETGKITVRCPRCGKPIIHEEIGTRMITRCTDPNCIGKVSIGI